MAINYEQEQTHTATSNYAHYDKSLATVPGFQLPANATFADRIELAKHVGQFLGETRELQDFMGRTITVKGLISHAAEIPSMLTGEMMHCIRTVFLLQDGTLLSTVSKAVARFVEQHDFIFSTTELGLLPEPVKIEVLPQKTRQGNRTFALKVVG